MSDEYIKAKKAGDAEFRKAILKEEYPYIPSLDSIVDTAKLKQVKIGLMQIPAEMIVGTKTDSRQNAFARNFMPIMDSDTEFAYKWANVYRAQENIGISDPILVYEYKHRFYVQEGNKRVSVFRCMKVPTVAAEVIRILPEEEDPLYKEFLTFFQNTHVYEMDFSNIGDYRKLCRYFNMQWNTPWPENSVLRLRALYYEFAAEYKMTDEDSSVSDAFLLYLNVFGQEGVRSGGRAALRANIHRLQKEFQLVSEKEKIQLVETPEAEEEKKGVLGLDLLPRLSSLKGLHVSFIYDSSPDVSADVYEHEIGRILLASCFDGRVKTEKYENCDTKEKLRKALAKAARESDVIFTTSPLQLDETLRCAVSYPDVKYFNCSLNQKMTAVRSYDVRMYEAKFLLGAVAASLSKDHQLAYLADYPVFGTMADINAFAIGAGLIDPQCRVFLAWSETLDEDWKEQMKRLGIKVFCGADTWDPRVSSTEYGLFELADDGSVINIAAPVINWAVYYEKIISRILSSNLNTAGGKAVNYWWGMDAGVIDITLSGRLPYQTRKLAELLKQSLIKGTLDPFAGELHAQNAVIQEAYAPKMSSDKIIAMDWLNDNIIGTLPPYANWSGQARKMIEVSGVNAVKATEE